VARLYKWQRMAEPELDEDGNPVPKPKPKRKVAKKKPPAALKPAKKLPTIKKPAKPLPSNPDFLPFWDAVHWIHKQKFTGLKDWQKFVKSGDLPPFIPANPEYEYGYRKTDEWRGWKVWIGTTAEAVIAAAQSKTQYLVVSYRRMLPPNILSFRTFRDTLENAITVSNSIGCVVLRVYEVDNKYMQEVGNIIEYLSTGSDMDSRVVQNTHALLFEMDSILNVLYREGAVFRPAAEYYDVPDTAYRPIKFP
jgi:hypothetical protein